MNPYIGHPSQLCGAEEHRVTGGKGDDHAAADIRNWMTMEKPQRGYQERCYYHRFPDEHGFAGIYQPKRDIGVEIHFDAAQLDGFVEWKMMAS